jgi:hypothetical protein
MSTAPPKGMTGAAFVMKNTDGCPACGGAPAPGGCAAAIRNTSSAPAANAKV